MNKHTRKWFLLIPLVIIIIVIVVLIYLKKEQIKENNTPKFSNDLVETKWNLDRIEVVTKEETTPIRTIAELELKFLNDSVSICKFEINENIKSSCSVNNYTRDGDTYKVEKDTSTGVYGTIKFDENGNIYLEQEDTEDYKTVYYFIKM